MIPYIDRDIIKNFLVTLVALLAFLQIGFIVSVLLQFLNFIFGEEESKLGWVILYYIFTIPRQVAYTFPVCSAMAILWVFTIKARQNELLAYLSGGVSPLRIARPVIILGFFLSISSYVIIDQLATNADRVAERIRRIQIESRSVETLTRERNVFQKGLGDRFYSIPAFDPELGTMNEPNLAVMREGWDTLDWSLSASRAEYTTADDGSRQWVFYGAVVRHYDEEGSLASFDRSTILWESELQRPIEKQLTEVLRQRWRPDQMSAMELISYMDLFRLQGRPTYELSTFFHFNLAIPFGCLVLAVLMCGHILRPASAGAILGFGGGMALMAFYFGVLVFARTMAKDGFVSAPLTAHGVNALFLLFGIWMLRRNRAL